ncbi:MAG: EamA family transporter [Pseudomonadota bacterium]|nr:EamA family transporter [Pseudomonadota bacterium]
MTAPATRLPDIALTALAPAIWGSTFVVSTELLPAGHPLTLAMFRALPAGLLLLAVTRRLPQRAWIGRTLILGALNFAIFWTLLFVAAFRLPGGIAATLGAMQALMVIGMARGWLGTPIRAGAVVAAIAGVSGVALLLSGPVTSVDPVGVAAGLGASASMAAGTVLSRRWQPPVGPLAVTAWQLTAGGLLLVPLALAFEPAFPVLTVANLAGMAWLGLVGAALTYWLWFRGLARLEPAAVSILAMMSPVTAVALGWLLLDQHLTPLQGTGAAIVLLSVWAGQVANRAPARPASLGERVCP